MDRVVKVQVRDREIFEGVSPAVAPELEIGRWTRHRANPGTQSGSSSMSAWLLTSLRWWDQHLAEEVIFRQVDVATICAPTDDLDFDTRESSTDATIREYSGQLGERTLEPWTDGGTADGTGDAG